MKQFYSHLVEYESIMIEMDSLELSGEERFHLAQLVDSNLHNIILDAVFSQLQEEDKKLFIEHISKNDHDKIWELLNNKVDGMENKIKDTAEKLKQELHKDLKEAKGKLEKG